MLFHFSDFLEGDTGQRLPLNDKEKLLEQRQQPKSALKIDQRQEPFRIELDLFEKLAFDEAEEDDTRNIKPVQFQTQAFHAKT